MLNICVRTKARKRREKKQ